MFDVLGILSNVFGFASGTLELFAGGWGFLQLIIDTFSGIAEAVMNLLG